MRSIAATGESDNLPDGILPEERAEADLSPEEADGVLVMFRETLRGSSTFLDKSHRAQIDRNHANARSKHPDGSKYLTPAYKHRSKLFKPKTKAGLTRAEAACSAAFFSTTSVVDLTAEDEDDVELAAGARIWNSALDYHLRESIRWKQTVIGALQNAWVEGICITTQYWDYQTDADGDITHDQPACRLIPLAKFRFSPHADWRDIVRSSAYLIEEMNPTVGEVLDQMQAGPNGEPPRWRPCSAATIMAAAGSMERSTGRHGQDGPDEEAVDLHKEARVFRCIVARGGVDWVFYTLGEMHMLTKPTKLKDIHPQGIRNYAIGGVTIESHRTIPQSKVEQGEALQAEINSITNDRRDAVKLSNSPRYLAKRGSGLDMASMLRNVPGGVTLTNDPNGVVPLQTKDVTSSAYKEEEVVAAAFDEVLGSFSQQSANTNSNIGRTATGLELIASDSNIMTEYAMELFATTWMQDALRQILIFTQTYETDVSVIGDAMKEADVTMRFGITPETASERMLRTPVRLRINVGVDATNPERKVLKMRNFIQMAVELGRQINADEVLKETAGAMGYDDGERFLLPPEEQEQMEDPAAQADAMKAEIEGGKLQVAQQKLHQDGELQMQRLQLDGQKAMQAHELNVRRAELDLQRAQLDAMQFERGIESAEEIALMKDRTERQRAMLDADTRNQHAILQGDIAAMRDITDREKAVEGFTVQREGLLSQAQPQREEQTV